jgi:hypothetical protein
MPLAGFRNIDLFNVSQQMIEQAIKQPPLALKHYTDFLLEMGRVMTGQSTVEPDARDKRFTDEIWKTNPFYRSLLQTYLTWEWARVRRNSLRSSTSFSQPLLLPRQMVYDPEVIAGVHIISAIIKRMREVVGVRLALPPTTRTGLDPPGGDTWQTPDTSVPWEVAVHPMTSHFPALHMDSFLWVTQKGDRQWEDIRTPGAIMPSVR